MQLLTRILHRIFIYLLFAVMCLIPLGVTHLLFQWPLLWCFLATGALGFYLLTAFVSNLPTYPVKLTELAPALSQAITYFLIPIGAAVVSFYLFAAKFGRGPVTNVAAIVVGAIFLVLLLREIAPQFVNRIIRGRDKPTTINAADLPLVLSENDDGILWGGALLPSTAATNHFMVVGATGSGKTLTIRLLMQRVLRAIGTGKNHRALIYDAKQDVVSLLAGMGLDRRAAIYTLNPFDARCVCWDMQMDITEPATAFQAATLLIPDDKNSSQPFFVSSAQSLLYGVMLAFIMQRKNAGAEWRFSDLVRAMQSTEQLNRLLNSNEETKPIATRFFSNKETLGNIMSTVATKMLVYEPIAAMWDKAYDAGNRVSLTDWLLSPAEREQAWLAREKEAQDASRVARPSQSGTFPRPKRPLPSLPKPASFENYILILGNNEKARRPLDAINRVLFQRVTELILDQGEVTKKDTDAGQERRTWLFLDEVAEAGRLDGLSSLLAKGRSKGACVVLGFQDIDGLKEVYGENLTYALTGQCAQKAILRLESPSTAEWASKLFGSYEAIEHRSSFTYSEQNSVTIAQEYVNRQSVLESEFFTLPPISDKKGLSGFYIAPAYGAYKHEYKHYDLFPGQAMEGKESSRRIIDGASDVLNYAPRHAAQQWLAGWTPDDMDRLHVPKEETEASPSTPPTPPSSGATPTPGMVAMLAQVLAEAAEAVVRKGDAPTSSATGAPPPRKRTPPPSPFTNPNIGRMGEEPRA